jgi:hypothetical protein
VLHDFCHPDYAIAARDLASGTFRPAQDFIRKVSAINKHGDTELQCTDFVGFVFTFTEKSLLEPDWLC